MNFIYSISLSFCGIIAAITVISYAFYLCVKKSRDVMLINKLPGPKAVLFFGNILPLLTTSIEDWSITMVRVTKNFTTEPLFRVWLAYHPVIFVNQAPAVEVVLNSTRLIDKGHSYDGLRPWLSLGLLTSTGDKWRSRRKLLTPSFHFRILDGFFKVFVDETEVLLRILDNLKDNDYFDIYPYLTRYTLDIICETAMGKRIYAQSDVSSEYVKAVNNLGRIFRLRIVLPWLKFNSIFNLTSYGKIQRTSLKIVHGFTNKVIQERWAEMKANRDENQIGQVSENIAEYAGKKRRLAFLDLLLENFRDCETLNVEDIREEVDTFMFEGHDTTSAGLAWILYNIGRYPKIQERVHQEIDNIFGNSNRVISKDDLSQLKYLEIVIKESLRLFPPVPVYTRKTMEEIDLCGYTIPAGVELLLHTYLIHRNEKMFPDPERFDPDRFLPEYCDKRHPFAYLPFSAGPRNCIGQKFAMMELKTAVCQILRKFKITSKHHINEMKILAELVLRPANGMWIKLESRH